MSVSLHEFAFPALVARLLLAAIFLRSGAVKVRSHGDFAAAVAAYEIVPQRLVPATARAIPSAELTVGSLLAFGLGLRGVAPLAALLLATFAVSMAVNLIRGRVIDCGCTAGEDPRPIGWHLVLTDLVLIAVLALVWLQAPATLWSPGRWDRLLPALLALGAAAIAASLAATGIRAARIGAR